MPKIKDFQTSNYTSHRIKAKFDIYWTLGYLNVNIYLFFEVQMRKKFDHEGWPQLDYNIIYPCSFNQGPYINTENEDEHQSY